MGNKSRESGTADKSRESGTADKSRESGTAADKSCESGTADNLPEMLRPRYSIFPAVLCALVALIAPWLPDSGLVDGKNLRMALYFFCGAGVLCALMSFASARALVKAKHAQFGLSVLFVGCAGLSWCLAGCALLLGMLSFR